MVLIPAGLTAAVMTASDAVRVDLRHPRTKVEFVRVHYDVDHAASTIREIGLPSEFAEMLRSGGASPAAAHA